MQDKTLGELLRSLGRYRAQVVPLVLVVLVAIFFPGSHTSGVGRSADAAGARSGGPQSGAADVGEVLAAPGGGSLPGTVATDVLGALDSAGTASAPDEDGVFNEGAGSGPVPPPPAAPADPLGLLMNQLGPLLTAAEPARELLTTVNPLLPALPVPPPVALPGSPPELNPAWLALQPATSEVCGQAATAVLLTVILASFPTPVTAQHINAVLGPIFDTCAFVTPN